MRLFSNIPRLWLTIPTILGGVAGFALSTGFFHWTALQTFWVTLWIAFLFMFISVALYRLTHLRIKR